jgi:hypothetical protein
VKRIHPVSEGSAYIKSVYRMYVCMEDLFRVMHETHQKIGHGGRNRSAKELYRGF